MITKGKITITVLVVIGIVGGIIAGQQLNKHAVDITLTGSDYAVEIYEGEPDDGKLITSISASQQLSLKDGYYCSLVNGEKYDKSKTCFSVYKNDTDVTIDPSYNSEHLAELLAPRQDTINNSIAATYPALQSGYVLDPGQLVNKGEWYITTITQQTASASEQGDIYRLILHKNGDTWAVAAPPRIVLSSVEHKDIPKSVVQRANNL